MILLYLLAFNISTASNLGSKYGYFAKFLDIKDTIKLKKLSSDRLLQKRIKNDFEIAVTKSYGDMEIWKKKSSNEFEFFHASTKNRILYGQKKHLAAEVEIFFQHESLYDFDLIGGPDPSLNLIARRKNSNKIALIIDFEDNQPDEERTKQFLKEVARIDLDENNLVILPQYHFIVQKKGSKTLTSYLEYASEHDKTHVAAMIEKCLYIDLMKTNFAKLHMLYQSSQLLKLFANCGAELPEENCFREICELDQTFNMMSYLETLIALNTNQKSNKQTLKDTENCETIETENYGNLQISRNKSTQQVKFMNLATNLECLQFFHQHEYFRKCAQVAVAKYAPVKEQYKFYGSQDATSFYAVNRKTKKCVDIADESAHLSAPWVIKMRFRILKLLMWVGAIFSFIAPGFLLRFISSVLHVIFGRRFEDVRYFKEYKERQSGVVKLLESVTNLDEFDVLIGIEYTAYLVNKKNKNDIRYVCSDSLHNARAANEEIVEKMKKYLNRPQPLTQEDYISFLGLPIPNEMKTSLQILTLFKQNGMQIDDRICEKFGFMDFDGNNHLRCMYERILMLKMLKDENL